MRLGFCSVSVFGLVCCLGGAQSTSFIFCNHKCSILHAVHLTKANPYPNAPLGAAAAYPSNPAKAHRTHMGHAAKHDPNLGMVLILSA